MNKFGLRDWIILLTLLPTITIGVLLGGYFTLTRYLELNEFLLEQGKTIITPLARQVEDALGKDENAKVRQLISEVHNQHSPLVTSVTLFNAQHQIILTSNYHSEVSKLKAKDGEIGQVVTYRQSDKDIVYIAPLYDRNKLDNDKRLIDSDELPVLAYLSLQVSKDKAIMAKQQVILVSTIVIASAIGFALLLVFRLSSLLNEPIRQIVLYIDKLKNNDCNNALNEPMEGEFELMRQGLNDIAKTMSQQKEQMQRHIDQAIADYRETLEQYETQNIQLTMAKREAQQANKVKSDFLAKMSHELRTPLNGVIGFARQLNKTPLNKNQRDYLETIEISANSLLSIISDILDFSKLEAGAMQLEHIPFQLRDTVNEVITLLAPIAHEKRLELSLYIDSKIPDNVLGDPTRFKQVLINLINNAIKFTEHGYVTIDINGRFGADNKLMLLCAINDSGIGIDSAKQDSLFMAFGQADSSITRKFGGTGLGLIITKHLVEAMNGNIALNSAVGKGSCFTFSMELTLPKRDYSSDLPVSSLAKKRVLYFEPFEHAFESLSEQLSSWDVSLTACNTIAQFEQALYSDFNFDIALFAVDLHADNLDQIKHQISRTREKCDYLYVLVNTVSHGLREIVIKHGADACLTKPTSHRKLCEIMAAPYRLDHPSLHLPSESDKLLPLKALVVDDNDANLKLMCALLEEMIESFDTAHNGAQAVSLAKSNKYDLIFLDIQMPIMDGITACKLILEQSLNEQTPIVAVTAHALASEKESLLNTGFASYLTKPIDDSVLKQTILDFNGSSYIPNVVIKSPVDSTPPFSSHLLDWPLALQRAGGKQELAEEMIAMLLQSIGDVQQQINDYASASKTEELLQVIHKFHGACCYTGVPKIKQLAELIETALKEGKQISDIEPELFELDDVLSQLMHHAKDSSLQLEVS